ncbi:hypothetical protein ACOME3_002857 [Neoechinorhynchus agilis]
MDKFCKTVFRFNGNDFKTPMDVLAPGNTHLHPHLTDICRNAWKQGLTFNLSTRLTDEHPQKSYRINDEDGYDKCWNLYEQIKDPSNQGSQHAIRPYRTSTIHKSAFGSSNVHNIICCQGISKRKYEGIIKYRLRALAQIFLPSVSTSFILTNSSINLMKLISGRINVNLSEKEAFEEDVAELVSELRRPDADHLTEVANYVCEARYVHNNRVIVLYSIPDNDYTLLVVTTSLP